MAGILNWVGRHIGNIDVRELVIRVNDGPRQVDDAAARVHIDPVAGGDEPFLRGTTQVPVRMVGEFHGGCKPGIVDVLLPDLLYALGVPHFLVEQHANLGGDMVLQDLYQVVDGMLRVFCQTVGAVKALNVAQNAVITEQNDSARNAAFRDD